MASRGPRVDLSSPDLSSPEIERYDPFRDPIELATLSPPIGYGENDPRRRSHSRSPDGLTPTGIQPSSYFGASQPGGQYAPLNRAESPKSAVRSTRESLFTVNSLYQSKTVDADTQALVDRRAGEIAQWEVHWITPTLIGLLFVLGVAAAIGHHFFYDSLDGKPATQQLKMVRYGTALAFFVKSTLVGTTVICNRQRIWRTFRTRAMTIKGIDGLFSAAEDPIQFFVNWEMIKNGKLATLMAAFSWLIPIASVLSPAALTSELSVVNITSICPQVANLNFSRESVFNFRNETENAGHGTSLNFYNTTDVPGKAPGFFDYYDQPSKNARRLAYSAAYLKKPLARDNARSMYCGSAYNCTFPLVFQGPGYKCDDITNSSDSGSPFTIDTLAPVGNFTYFAEVSQGDYKWPQIDSKDGAPVQPPPYPASLGVFQSEPILWVGYTIKMNQSYPSDSPYAGRWKNVHQPKMFKCVMYHTNYTFQMQYMPSQNATLMQRDFLRPVVDTTLQVTSLNSTNWTATPSSNFIRPQDAEEYKLTSAYHTMGSLLRSFLSGNIERNSLQFIITRSDISETRLVNSLTAYPVPNLMDAVQNMFEDMLITLLSEPALVIADNGSVSCQKLQSVVLFRYVRRALWIGYAAVISVTFCFVLVGAWSIHQNGVSSDVLFSRIMVTTRNPTLDQLSVGACLGGDPFPKELTKTKLRFGVLLEDEPRDGPLGVVEHCCFGTVGETKEIVKGGTYSGLKRWRKDSTKESSATLEEKEPLLGEDDKKSV